MTIESRKYHYDLEIQYTNASLNEEDNKIAATYEETLIYLQTALEDKKINETYGKYFAYAKHKAQVADFKADNPDATPDKIKNFKKNNLVNMYYEYFGKINESDDLHVFKALSVKMVALDKINGILHLITKNQRPTLISQKSNHASIINGQMVPNPGVPMNIFCYSYLKVQISTNPNFNDWKRVNFLLQPKSHDYNYETTLIYDGIKFSEVSGITDENIKINFVWENHKSEIPKKTRSFLEERGWIPNAYKERKYLYLEKNNETLLFIKSHGDETPLLIPEDYLRGENIPLTNPTPQCFVIPNRDIVELFKRNITNIKSANSTAPIF